MAFPHRPAGNGWQAADLTTERVPWRVALPAEVAAELQATLETTPPQGDPPPGGLRYTADFAAALTDRLVNGPGVVLVTGVPVEDEDRARGLLWSFGRVMGQPVPQNPTGTLIGRVEDLGGQGPNYNGHQIHSKLAFHVDRADVVALLSMRSAPAGGLSLIASSLAVHDVLLEEHPDLLEELYRPLPHFSGSDDAPREAPWYEMPVFAEVDGRLIVHYVRRFIESSQRNPRAPRLTERQRRAMDAVDEILIRDGMAFSMDLRPGDLQLINNFSVLHSRTGFTSPPDEPGRLLFRLWLSITRSPRLPASYARHFSSVSPGVVRGGVWPPDQGDMIGRPVEVAG